MVKLKGITWDHPRGYDPLIETSRQFTEQNPDITITWDKRTLAEFGDFPVEELANKYDLLMIDHPFTGEAYEKNLYVNLKEQLSEETIDTVKEHSLGKTYESYVYNDKVLALPVDAAALVSAARLDQFERLGLKVPKTIDDIFELSKQLPKDKFIDVALCHIDIWCVFLSLCAATAGQDFFDLKTGIDLELGAAQIKRIKELAAISHHDAYTLNPIHVLNEMTFGESVIYSPYLFGYVNYAMEGKYPNIINFYDAPLWEGKKTSTILGGVGVAISTKSNHIAEAAKYVEYVTSPEVQRGSYFQSGGQPSTTEAWESKQNNETAHQFFENTIDTLEHAYMRPRVPRWNQFQEKGSMYLWKAVQEGVTETEIVTTLNEMFQEIIYRG